MYMRVFRAQAKPGTVDELAQRMQKFIDSNLRGVSGLQHMYCGGDRGSDQVVLVSVWDSQESMTSNNQNVQAFAGQVRDLLADQPVVVTYEVVAQV